MTKVPSHTLQLPPTSGPKAVAWDQKDHTVAYQSRLVSETSYRLSSASPMHVINVLIHLRFLKSSRHVVAEHEDIGATILQRPGRSSLRHPLPCLAGRRQAIQLPEHQGHIRAVPQLERGCHGSCSWQSLQILPPGSQRRLRVGLDRHLLHRQDQQR